MRTKSVSAPHRAAHLDDMNGFMDDDDPDADSMVALVAVMQVLGWMLCVQKRFAADIA